MALFDTGYKEYSQKVNYLSISNLADLKATRLELEHKIIHKELELKMQYGRVKQVFNPVNYIVNGLIQKFTSLENIIRCFCKGVNFARDIINQYKENRENKTATSENQINQI